MTVIAYYKDHLLADRKTIRNQGDYYQNLSEGKKLYVSKCQRIAFVNSGEVIHAEDLNSCMDIFLENIGKAERTGLFYYAELSKMQELLVDTNARNFIVMSKKHCYIYKHKTCINIAKNEVEASGTGAMTFYTAAATDMPVSKIIPFVASLMITVSKEFDKFPRSGLKPF
jgi:hypothetical protein